ncbi:Rna polymerase ii c-terminal domain phosphatase-like [Thalictrum thalictroides]|uniref:RNA polymerase II C-terminal domain phosphatase-like n=1 Tax=Thalictrum thalictroides TaxID=46969 RepID=A0A7J6VPN6_THATH|nr:Rna polymerase ii c-terminal domain phosphatase-like [Thalictrum thalictroides]
MLGYELDVSESENKKTYSDRVPAERISEHYVQTSDALSAITCGYIHKDFRVSTEERDQIRAHALKNMLDMKKLYLILDLDETLLHSFRLDKLTAEEKHSFYETDSMKDVSQRSFFQFENFCWVTKLRPFVRTFLEEASKIYEMYVYTRGTREYAEKMVQLLDPQRNYFGHRLISRNDCTEEHGKTLDIVLAAENAVVILDDTESAWKEQKENLIVINKYYYFDTSGSCVSPSESETDGALAKALTVLKLVHQMFFDLELGVEEEEFTVRDVRNVLKTVCQEFDSIGVGRDLRRASSNTVQKGRILTEDVFLFILGYVLLVYVFWVIMKS